MTVIVARLYSRLRSFVYRLWAELLDRGSSASDWTGVQPSRALSILHD